MSSMSQFKNTDVVLIAEPDVAFFNPAGGKSDHMLTNTSDKRLTIKVRCSNNTLYRVNPVCMFLEAGQCQTVSVQRLPGPPRADKLVVQYLECSRDELDARKPFTELDKAAPPPPSIKIALKMDGGSQHSPIKALPPT